METKTALQSKTIWMNLASMVSVIITALVAEPTFAELVGGTMIVALNVANMVLRKYTTKPLDGVVKPKPKTDLEIFDELNNSESGL